MFNVNPFKGLIESKVAAVKAIFVKAEAAAHPKLVEIEAFVSGAEKELLPIEEKIAEAEAKRLISSGIISEAEAAIVAKYKGNLPTIVKDLEELLPVAEAALKEAQGLVG